jgi:lysyl-tRNA synthetase, class II
MSGFPIVRRWSVAALAAIAAQIALDSFIGFGYRQIALEVGVILLVMLGVIARRRAGTSRSQRMAVSAVLTSWGLTSLAMLLAALASARPAIAAGGRVLRPLIHGSAPASAATHQVAPWTTLTDLLIGCALITSVLAVRSLVRPGPIVHGSPEHEQRTARAIVDEHGEDSLSPFILRPDKTFEFAAGGVLAYRVIGKTAVVSGDPVAPDGSAPDVLAQFLRTARSHGWRVALYGSSARHLEGYRGLGLRAICVGEEAVVDPARFTLEGRAVRKLRQSAHRVERRGWVITACDGNEIGTELGAEIDALEAAWRATKRRLLGFAMAMGEFDPGVRPHDLYLLARSPEGDLRGVMRFLSHRGKLSLDTMRRVGETPNGLNEALVCRALEVGRDRGVSEVSLNYAGLGHLVRNDPSGNPLVKALIRLVVGLLGRRFQMERLVRFNEKFSPEWRPRYLVYESLAALPGSVHRVLQAEGYLPQPKGLSTTGKQLLRQRLDGLATAETHVEGRLTR